MSETADLPKMLPSGLWLCQQFANMAIEFFDGTPIKKIVNFSHSKMFAYQRIISWNWR